ncbi:hypothetical protein X777_12311 [Ooceraea biroi]|uniref:Uncharacterized protein n=1 Tax=Ooceraea biroi TaxID=2015173 RepID=A0A026W127_OOCBI|nr:hypothetical protein X777_12311 [Ooceraea biroi]
MSANTAAQVHDSPPMSVHRILRKNKLHPYKLQFKNCKTEMNFCLKQLSLKCIIFVNFKGFHTFDKPCMYTKSLSWQHKTNKESPNFACLRQYAAI